MAVIIDSRPVVKNKRDHDETDIEQENEKEEDNNDDNDEETPKKRKKTDQPKVRELVRDLIQTQHDGLAIPKAQDMEVSVTLNQEYERLMLLFDQVCEAEPFTTCVPLLSQCLIVT